jgi:hypothetical protein
MPAKEDIVLDADVFRLVVLGGGVHNSVRNAFVGIAGGLCRVLYSGKWREQGGLSGLASAQNKISEI